MEIILILFLLAFIFLVLKVLYDSFQVVRAIAVFIYKRYINASLIYVDLKPRYKKILADYVDYYRNLDDRHRHNFEQRVARFMGMKEFIARGKGMDVTPEMRVLISAVAIQLTFGLPRVYLTHFHRILIYPDSYYSTISQRYHHGEVNYRGLIILSWKKFLEGWINRDDGTNLGLHEMAHALHLENGIRNEEFGFLNEDIFLEYEDEARQQIKRIEAGDTSFFREYAATNEHEFFAVAIENFFERPAEFKNYNDRLYRLISGLLHQDPLLRNPLLVNL